MRKKSKSKFEQDFYKLLINSVYGKFVENRSKHKNILLVSSWSKGITNQHTLEELCAKPNFRNVSIFDESLACVEMGVSKIKYNTIID